MNFFEHQDRARRQTKFLVFLFSLAVIGIIAAVNLVILFTVGPDVGLMIGASFITGAIIGLASMFRAMQLRGGGGEVARSLGGVLVEPGTTDPLRRRLRNVVEEMAIASGVPVPEVYVLEHEQGINAFAAGYSPADAAVAVTRGTLEHLDRDELQGVIAHEFSHVLNGDMRLNIRLVGFLFGILVIAIIGRRLLFSARYARDSRSAAPAVAIGLAVMLVGYIGLFFGRWIKAAVSRQREFLADASAVQFTRHPDGISGALKKIGALYAGSFMTTDSEEVGHMLFARGMGRQMFATHPPLEERIRAIDPNFEPEEFKRIAEQLDRHAQARKAEAEAEQAEAAEERKRGPGGLPLDPENLAEQIGQPGLNQVFIAAALAAAIPKPLERAAHSDEWAMETVCYLLLSNDPDTREEQLLMITRQLGEESERQVRALRQACPELAAEQRLPLLEIVFPSLRKRPERELLELMALIEQLIQADGQIDVFEWSLARLAGRHIEDALHPERVQPGGRKKLEKLAGQAATVISVLAAHGHPDHPEQARSAFEAATTDDWAGAIEAMPEVRQWHEELDQALKVLDSLKPSEKQKLVTALARCVMHDGEIVLAEAELMRAICGLLHVPLPVFGQAEEESAR